MFSEESRNIQATFKSCLGYINSFFLTLDFVFFFFKTEKQKWNKSKHRKYSINIQTCVFTEKYFHISSLLSYPSSDLPSDCKVRQNNYEFYINPVSSSTTFYRITAKPDQEVAFFTETQSCFILSHPGLR